MTDMPDSRTHGELGETPETTPRDADPHVQQAVVEDLDLPDEISDNLRAGCSITKPPAPR